MKKRKDNFEKLDIKDKKKKVISNSNKGSKETLEDVQKLVYLLQVHQVELEHQNQELRLTQEELEVSRNKYVNLFDFSPVPYFTLNIDGIIREVNLRGSSMLGIDRKRIIGKRFHSFLSVDELVIFNSFLKYVFTTEEKQTCELKLLNKEKQTFHILLEAQKFDDTFENEVKCHVALIDLTGYKNIEESLKKANKELKASNDTKDKFFSIIAHDLRSPFQSLLMSSELFSTEIETKSKEDIENFSKGLNKTLINLLHLLENLLNWSMIQRDQLEFKPEKINLNEALNSVIEILNQCAKKKSISISKEIETSTIVYADAQMLRLAFHNLLVNAIKFTKKEGKIVISSREKSRFVEISIIDTGIGMTHDKYSTLFDLDSKYSSHKGTEGETGSGLGLHLCKEFIEKNKGNIWVESELGKGSKFTFTIPKAISLVSSVN
jgi:PAS domain S-box-containing protein